MNVRCLIGHDYGDPRTSRDREERGEEVVVTEVEYRECSRCGDRRVVSENKEVTSIEAGSAGAGGDRDPDDADPGGNREPSHADPGGTGADIDEPGEAGVGGGSDTGEYDTVPAEEDDGVILEDDPDGGDRERGEWPDVEAEGDEGDGEHHEWPEAEGEDEGYAAAAPDDPVDGLEFGGGITPESRPKHPAEVEGGEERIEDTADASGIKSADPGPSPTRGQPPGDDTEFACPECGHTAPSHGSSLRPGDICPECREGYLAEREAPAGE